MNASLVIPISFKNSRASSSSWFSTDSETTALVSWGYTDSDTEIEELKSTVMKKPLWGTVAGFSNGSLVIFHPDHSRSSKQKAARPGYERALPSGDSGHLPNRRPAHLALPHSRTTSPSASKTSLTAISSSKSRAVSGLSKEQAEAPKSYVDFEEEQERMKEMLGDRAVRDRTMVDGLKPQLDQGVVFEKSPRSSRVFKVQPPQEPSSRRPDDARSVASVDSSTSMTPMSILSPPLSPTLGPSKSYMCVDDQKPLLPKVRILPRDFGFGHGVADIKILDEGELFLVLQESG